MGKSKNIEAPIQYQCDNCGAKVAAYREIPRCLACGKNLCSICNNFLLCPQDFHRLDPKDQKKIKRLGTSLNNIHNTAAMFKVMPGVLGGIGALLLILMIIFDDEIFYFIFGFLGGFLLLASFMMYGVFHNIEEKERKRVSDQVRSIVLPYNIQQVFHKNENMNQKAEIQTVNSDKWSKEDNAEEDNIIICPTCGEEVKGPNVKYCENCGELLK